MKNVLVFGNEHVSLECSGKMIYTQGTSLSNQSLRDHNGVCPVKQNSKNKILSSCSSLRLPATQWLSVANKRPVIWTRLSLLWLHTLWTSLGTRNLLNPNPCAPYQALSPEGVAMRIPDNHTGIIDISSDCGSFRWRHFYTRLSKGFGSCRISGWSFPVLSFSGQRPVILKPRPTAWVIARLQNCFRPEGPRIFAIRTDIPVISW